jgi:PAS domain S-box-containing protein
MTLVHPRREDLPPALTTTGPASSFAPDADVAPQAIDLQSAYASAPIGLGCVDRDLRYVYINDRLAEYHRRPAAEHIGRTLREMTTPDVADQLERVYRHVLTTGEPVLDFELSSSDPAAKHTCIGSYTPVRDDRGAVVGVNAVVQDITHRRMYLAALEDVNRSLRERDEFLHGVGDKLPQAMLYRATNPPSGGFRFVYVSKGVEEVTGLTAERLLTDPTAFVDMIVEEDRPTILNAMAESVRTLANFDRVFRVRWPDGSVRWSHLRSAHRRLNDGSVLCEGIMLDTTALKKAQEDLTDSQARNQAMLAALPDLVFLMSTDGTYLDVHPREHRHFLISPDDFLGRKVTEVMPPDLASQIMRCIAQVAAEGSARLEYDVTIGKESRHFEARMVPSGPSRILVVARDLTENKRAQDDAAKSRLELARISRLTMLGEITASLAHELNQPLTAILSNARAARFLLGNDPVDGELAEILEEIAEASLRAGDVIRRVRTWVARDQLLPQQLDLNDVVADVERLLHSELIIRQVCLSLSLQPGLPPVSADRIQLQQVILNLSLNGIEAMHDRPALERHLSIATALVEGGVQVAVRDVGSGIGQENLDRLFDPFFSTKPSGLGIGLSICSSIVSAHGGRIWAENNAGPGATLFFILPVIGAPA